MPLTYMPLTYEIRTIGDFLKVPLDRLPDCLEDFTMWCAIAQAVVGATENLDGVVFVKMTTDVFRWVDDGKHEANLNITLHRRTPGGEK